MGPGGTLHKYARAGHRVCVLTVTEGGAGRLFEERPTTAEGVEELKRRRRAETAAAAGILGFEHLGFLGWDDGQLRHRDLLELEETFVRTIREVKADVVISFHASGISYHPDHRVVTHAALGAFAGAGTSRWYQDEELRAGEPYAPQKLYLYAPSYENFPADEWPRDIYVAPAEEITTEIDTEAHADTKWAAIEAHASQQFGPPFQKLYEAGAFRRETFVRIFPSHPAEHPRETDLLAGLQES